MIPPVSGGDEGVPGLAAVRTALAERVASRFDADLERIRAYLRLPSISATGEGIAQCAQATAQLITNAGGEALVVPTRGNPVVIGTFPGPDDGPKLLRYCMYDVQPCEGQPWTSPPFGAEIVEREGLGRVIVGRGTHNSKACLAAQMIAVEILRELELTPVRLALLVDGEEEIGSPHLGDAIAEHRSLLSADAAFDLELSSERSRDSELVFGCKGLLKLRLSVRGGGDWGGPGADVHSGEAAWIASPAWALVHALAALVDEQENVLVPSFADEVAEPTARDLADIAELDAEFDASGRLRAAAARRAKPGHGARELSLGPTFNISSFMSGHIGAGTANVLPGEAHATVDIRLVPGMTGAHVTRTIREHLDRSGFGHCEIEVLEDAAGAQASRDSVIGDSVAAAQSALGYRARRYPIAPYVMPLRHLTPLAGGNWVVGALGHAAGAHGPDEYAVVEHIREHIIGVALCMWIFGERWRAAQAGNG
jgi:acetylornithine deacetylase/succinyl-diaminopimelate desuccinylase-like protein